MSSHLVDRIARMLKDGVAGFMDGLEDGDPVPAGNPALTLIEEMRDALSSLAAERHLAGKRLNALDAQLADIGGKAELAVGADRDDLARAVLGQRHALAEERAGLEASLRKIDAESGRLSQLIEQMKHEAGLGGSLTAAEEAAFRDLQRLAAGRTEQKQGD